MYERNVPYTPRINKNYQNVFGGLNHTESCGEGQIYDMEGIDTADYPVLEPVHEPVTPPEGQNWTTKRDFYVSGVLAEEDMPVAIRGVYKDDRRVIIEDDVITQDGWPTPLDGYYGWYLCDDAKNHNGDAADRNNNFVLATNDATFPGTGEDPILYDPDHMEAAQIGRWTYTNAGYAWRNDVRGYYTTYAAMTADRTEPEDMEVNAVVYANYDADAKSYTVWNYYQYSKTDEAWIKSVRRSGSIRVRDVPADTGGLILCDGTLHGVAAAANTLKLADGGTLSAMLQAGDTVRIIGCADAANNKFATIREVSADGKQWHFDENTFTISGSSQTEANGQYFVQPPRMDYICSVNNRVFGCYGDTIWACALGDPHNWWRYDNLASDAYSVEVGSTGDFTGCAAWNGYPIFFKEDRIYRLYNTETAPLSWQLVETKAPGVMKDCHRSCVEVGGALYYMSRAGVMRFSGGQPQRLEMPIGRGRPRGAVAGRFGRDCLISVLYDDANELLRWSTDTGAWFVCEQTTGSFIGFAPEYTSFANDIYTDQTGKEWPQLIGTYEGPRRDAGIYDLMPERGAPVRSRYRYDTLHPSVPSGWLEFGDVIRNTTDKKQQQKFGIIAKTKEDEIDEEHGIWEDNRIEVFMSIDGGEYELMGVVKTDGKKKIQIFSFPPARNDMYRLKLVGYGDWKLYAVSSGYLSGTELV